MPKKNTAKRNDPSILGERVKAYRFSRGYWTQDQMALHCNVSVVSIRRIEAGEKMGPVVTDKVQRAMAGVPAKVLDAIAKEAKAS